MGDNINFLEEATKRLNEERIETAIDGIARRLKYIEREEAIIKDLRNEIELIDMGKLHGNEDQQSCRPTTL